jgi:FKBP12-rapamycin complex-associated protein
VFFNFINVFSDPLHRPYTPHEKSFHQHFGKELDRALDWCQKFQQSDKVIFFSCSRPLSLSLPFPSLSLSSLLPSPPQVADLNNAWDLYYHVFRRIDKQLPQMTALELQYVSPALLDCQNMELAVPGTYEPGKPVVKIRSFFPLLQVKYFYLFFPLPSTSPLIYLGFFFLESFGRRFFFAHF